MADQEPTDQDAAEAEGVLPQPKLKGRRSFSRMRRELTEEEMGNSAVQKMMMDELDRLDEENSGLRLYVDKYHDSDKMVSTLQEKMKNRTSSEITFGGFLTVGSAAIGYAQISGPTGSPDIVVLAFGILLIVAGIASKVVLK